MRKATIALLLVASMATAGCLGSVTPAQIDSATLDEKGWSEKNEKTETAAAGLAEIVTIDYQDDSNPQTTGAIVVSTTNVPILDESRFIPQAIERVEKQRNIDLQKAGTTQISLPQLGSENVEAQLYDFQKSGASGKLILFTPDQCGPFVVTAGYGITGAGGISGVEKTYSEAKDVARNVVCG